MNHITTFVFDVDGVLTDGSIIITSDGQQLRNMNIKDGYALQLAVKKGYMVAIISGGTNEGVRMRLNGLGIHNIYLGASDKVEALKDLMYSYSLKTEEILYMGDDVPDFEVMQMCGMAASPADAAEDIKRICHYVSPKNGGQGCVRDVIEQTMRVQNKWMNGREDQKW